MDPAVIASILTPMGVAFGAWLTWLASGARELRERIESLEGRIGALETEKDELREERDGLSALVAAMASFINRISIWIESGMDHRRKPKPPAQIVPHIDAEPWTEGDGDRP